jgi:hypothetical protein
VLFLPRKSYQEPDAIEQVGVFDLYDGRELKAYNELIAQNQHTLEIVKEDVTRTQEKRTFDRQGVEIDYVAATMVVVVRYRIKPRNLAAPQTALLSPPAQPDPDQGEDDHEEDGDED